MRRLSYLEKALLVSRLFQRLVDEMNDEARDLALDLETIQEHPSYEEERTRNNVAVLLADAPTETLVVMHSNLFEESWTHPLTNLSGESWKEGQLRLFLSHCSSQKKLISEVAEALEEYGIDAFVAHQDIEPLLPWEREIEGALRECHACVAFLSDDFHDSNWTDQEVGFCFARELLIVPIRMGIDPYGFIARYQALTAGDLSAQQLAQRIFALLRIDDRLNDLLDWAVLLNFIGSGGFIEAKDRWKLVKNHVKAWPASRRYVLEVASAYNNQIASAHYGALPGTIEQFLKDLP